MESNYSLLPVDFNPFEGYELEKVVQISEPQREIWVSCILGGVESNLAYNLSVSVKFEGLFNIDAFEKTLHSVVSRHEAMRTTFSASGDYLMINKDIFFEVSKIDLSLLSSPQQEVKIKDHLDLEMKTPFDLLNGPLFRFSLHKTADDQYLFTLIIHHIIADGWSLGILLGDIAAYYSAYVTGRALPTKIASQISSYNDEEAHYKESNHYLKTEQYWLDIFKSDVPITDLPTDRPRPSPRTYNGHRYDFKINPDRVKRIKALGAPTGATLVLTLLSAFEILIHKKTNQDKIVIGLPTDRKSVV